MIKADNLVKSFDKTIALNNFSCSIPDGCIYGLVGSNGAGKSTFLRLLTGIYKPDQGSVQIDGQDVWENTALKNRIAYVPDELYFLQGATLQRMADLYANTHPNFDKKRYDELVSAFEFDPNKSIDTFSKGKKRQAATVLALSTRPDYLVFDETFDGLDPIMRNYVKKLICQDIIERNASAIITSHSLRELEDTCDQLALLHQGGLILQSDVQNLKTSLFKIQIAFSEEYDKSKFDGIDILHFVKHGSVASMIIRGSRDEAVARLSSMHPLILDVLPLSLEEVFTYEMESLGYSFQLY